MKRNGIATRIASAILMVILAMSFCTLGISAADAEQTPAEKYAQHRVLRIWDVGNIPYNNDGAKTTVNPSLYPYIAENNESGICAIVIPGGGYSSLSVAKDGTAIAEYLNSKGISAFVLHYRVTDGDQRAYDYRAMMSDALRAIKYVRYNAEEFGIDPDKLFTIGASAGGHLACMTATHYDFEIQDPNYTPDEIDELSAKPNATALTYPAVSISKDYAHAGTRNRFARGNVAIEREFSGENSVTKDTPPIFIWHTWQDSKVSVNNSLAFVRELEANSIPYEFHVYAEGDHGLGIATDGVTAYSWPDLMSAWIYRTLGN